MWEIKDETKMKTNQGWERLKSVKREKIRRK